jgi:hypothetical protein
MSGFHRELQAFWFGDNFLVLCWHLPDMGPAIIVVNYVKNEDSKAIMFARFFLP